MRIAISGSVGVGKTTISKFLSKKMNFDVIHLNEIAINFKIQDISHLQTFDFDVDKCLTFVEEKYKHSNNLIFEGHFSHLLSPEFVDFIIIINRDLKDLKAEYLKRKYNEQKIKDNLECESFNVCFYEAEEEGFSEKQFIVIENIDELDLDEIVTEIYRKIMKRTKK